MLGHATPHIRHRDVICRPRQAADGRPGAVPAAVPLPGPAADGSRRAAAAGGRVPDLLSPIPGRHTKW